jgi:DNA-binding transcriptional ArsR family regulator
MDTCLIAHATPAVLPDAEDGVALGHVFVAVAKYFGLLSDPTRLRILHTICRSERHVGAIVAAIGASQTNVSRHLAVLRAAGVVSRRKVRNTVFYKVADPMLAELCRTISEQIANRLEAHASRCDGPQARVSPH